MDSLWPAIQTLIPSIGILALFYVILRHIMEGDRRERVAQKQWERERDLAAGTVAPSETDAVAQNAHLPTSQPGTMDTRAVSPSKESDGSI